MFRKENKKSLTAKMFVKKSIFGSKAIFIYFDFLKRPFTLRPSIARGLPLS